MGNLLKSSLKVKRQYTTKGGSEYFTGMKPGGHEANQSTPGKRRGRPEGERRLGSAKTPLG